MDENCAAVRPERHLRRCPWPPRYTQHLLARVLRHLLVRRTCAALGVDEEGAPVLRACQDLCRQPGKSKLIKSLFGSLRAFRSCERWCADVVC